MHYQQATAPTNDILNLLG